MDAKKKKRIKRLTGLIVPILVLVVTVSVVGASFAWFSDNMTASIATIDLSVAEVFTLEFSKDNSQPDNYPYRGETGVLGIDPDNDFAIDPANGGYLVTNERAMEPRIAGNTYYMQDMAYKFETEVHFDTDPERFTDGITLAVSFEELQVGFLEDDRETLDVKRSNIVIPSTGHTDKEDICYGFTWYMYKEGTSTLITPYGTVNPDTPSTYWTNTPVKQNIANFNADNDDTYFFVIVFCPEKLYWMQYSNPDKDNSFKDVYGDEYATGTGADYVRGPLGYQSDRFQGATYNFKVKFERVA